MQSPNRHLVGPHAVKTGQKVYFNDSKMILPRTNDVSSIPKRPADVTLRLRLDYVDPMLQPQAPGMQELITQTTVVAATALFGGDPTVSASSAPSGFHPLRFGHGDGVRLVRFPADPLGCSPYAEILLDDEAIVVRRGDCTFLEKLIFAVRAGASGVVVLGDEDNHINPSADGEELDAVASAGVDINKGAIVVLRRSDAEIVERMFDAAELHGVGAMRLVVEPQGARSEMDQTNNRPTNTAKAEDATRILYLNNHPLLNTRLLL